MNFTIGVHFLEEMDEEVRISKRQLRDNSNVLNLNTNEFVANFRVSKEIFAMLLETLHFQMVPAFRSSKIRPDIKLATFLSFLATGNYQRTLGNKSLSSTGKSSVNRTIAEYLELFENCVCPQWIKMPTPENKVQIKQAFFERNGFSGVVGCVDGTHIRMKSPGDNLKRLYYNRKGFCSINAMMICDHNMTIMFVDARHPGSNHDAFIWEYSAVNEKLQNDFDGGKNNSYILCDGGYKLSPFRNPTEISVRRVRSHFQ